ARRRSTQSCIRDPEISPRGIRASRQTDAFVMRRLRGRAQLLSRTPHASETASPDEDRAVVHTRLHPLQLLPEWLRARSKPPRRPNGLDRERSETTHRLEWLGRWPIEKCFRPRAAFHQSSSAVLARF